MARDILDQIVKNNLLEKCTSDCAYADIMRDIRYAGKVTELPKKVDLLKSSDFGLQYISTFKSLSEKFQMFKTDLKDTEVVLKKADGSEVHCAVTLEQLAMLKALAIEQFNPCVEYSRVVAELFWDYARALVKGYDAKSLTFVDAKGTMGYKIKSSLTEYMISVGA